MADVSRNAWTVRNKCPDDVIASVSMYHYIAPDFHSTELNMSSSNEGNDEQKSTP